MVLNNLNDKTSIVINEEQSSTTSSDKQLLNGDTDCCSPGNRLYRYAFLFFLCFLNFSNFWTYDNPSALEQPIQTNLGVNDESYGILYSVYSWPNIVLTLLGGYLIDWILGIRWGAILFAAFVAVGQLVFALGGYFGLFWLMIVGRLIYAVGGANLSVAQYTYVAKWFKGNQLSYLFGIIMSSQRMGSTLNLFTMEPIFKAFGGAPHNSNKALGDSLLIGFGLCMLSTACGFVLYWFDKRRDVYLEHSEGSNQVEKRKITPRAILQFPLTYWLICFVYVTFFISIMVFISFGELFFVNKYKLSASVGNVCNAMIYLVCIPGLIISGFIVNYFGRNVLFSVISIVLALIGHCFLAFTFVTPYVGTALLGCAYSLVVSSLWPCVAYVVPKEAKATAYGVMQAIQNTGTAVALLLVGVIVDKDGYYVLEIYFVVNLCLCLGLGIALYFADYGKNGLLIMSSKQREEKLSQLE